MEMEKAAEAVLASRVLSKRFRLTGRAITGNFASAILVATSVGDSAEVVVKVLMREGLATELELRSARQEAAIHGGLLPHPNLVRLLASEETPDAILLVTPLMHGDLWGLMQYGQTFAEGQVRNCAGQMLSSLRHLHDVCGFIHTDIKPHNFLLLKSDGRHTLQLCDFGFAERPESGGEVTFYQVRGTSGWFSPEMLGHRNYGFPADLFGIGLIVFRMLGGYAPFDPPSRFQPTVEYDERCWCHTGDACRSLISRLLRLDPKGRGTAAEACRHPWLSGPEPAAPSPEQLAALSAYGPLPDFATEFWPAGRVPEQTRCPGDAELSTAAGTHGESFVDLGSACESAPQSPTMSPSSSPF